MSHFQTWFQDHGVYLLPDGTPVIARYCDLNNRPRWWFIEAQHDGQLGQLLAAVQPTGVVWNYVAGHDQAVRVPQRSDLTLADLRRTARHWVQRIGMALAVLWIGDGLCDVLGAACAVAL